VLQANSPQATLRKTAMRGLSDIIDADSGVLSSKLVEETIEMRLQDESSLVRQVSLDLLGRILEGSLDLSLEGGEGEAWAAPPARSKSRQDGSGDAASAMLLRFHATVRGRINDTSVLVRRQASKMLSAFVLNHPEHPDVEGVALDLLRRSTDSEILRNLVVGTFELLWFADDEPTPKQALQLSRVVDASRGTSVGPGDILSELLGRFQKSMTNRKHGGGFEHAMRRWTAVLLQEFVKFNVESAPARRLAKKSSGESLDKSVAAKDAWIQRRSLLSTLEAFAVARPRELLAHLRPLTVYLALEEDSPAEEQWIALKVCQILSAVLPFGTERRGLMDHRQVQQDLQVLIKNQPSSGVHEAVRCLCHIVKYVTGDLNQLLVHLNSAIPALIGLCERGEKRRGSLERIQQMFMSRQVWILASVLESLAIDDYIEKADGASSSRRLPRSALRFEMVGDSVASTVADLLVRLYAQNETQLQIVVLTCLGFFLKGHRSFVKERRIAEIFGDALAAVDFTIRLKALETLAALLTAFGKQADQESKVQGGPQDGNIAGTAVASAQPLVAYSDAVLAHVTLSPGAAEGGNDLLPRIRSEALAVVRQLNIQGLVNPMNVLPKVFALCFLSDAALAEPAGAMLKDMLELRPTLLLNRMDEAFREAFQATVLIALEAKGSLSQFQLTPNQLAPIADVYTERFRKQKAPREAFIRKALREVFRLHADKFQEQFAELLAAMASATSGKENVAVVAASPAKRARKLKVIEVLDENSEQDEFAGLSTLGRCQLYYAQFAATALSGLPFTFESEPLLTVFECNRHLSLHAGNLATNFEISGGGGEAVVDVEDSDRPLRPRQPDAGSNQGASDEKAADSVDAFGEAVSIVACVVIKRAMKAEYNLTAEQCAQFNPKEQKQERLRTAGFQLFSKPAVAGVPGDGEVPAPSRSRFPLEEWKILVQPLVAHEKQPVALAAYIKTLLEDNPWDATSSAHAAAVERLEGKASAKRGRPALEEASPAGLAKRARGRGRAAGAAKKGRGRGKAAAKKKAVAAARDDDGDEQEEVAEDGDTDEDWSD